MTRDSTDIASRTMASAVSMGHKAWLHCSAFHSDVKCKAIDLPLYGQTLIHSSTDEVLKDFKTRVVTAKSLSTITAPSPKTAGCFHTSSAFNAF